jgi:hypothetical protein
VLYLSAKGQLAPGVQRESQGRHYVVGLGQDDSVKDPTPTYSQSLWSPESWIWFSSRDSSFASFIPSVRRLPEFFLSPVSSLVK